MARFYSEGFDELVKAMTEVGELLNGPLARDMLVAGAEEVTKSWKETADKYGYNGSRDKATGEMLESIGYKPPQIGIDHCDILPRGVGSNGTRNAEKAFLLHYGWSGYSGTHWVDEADDKAEAPAIDAMRRVFDEAMKKKGL